MATRTRRLFFFNEDGKKMEVQHIYRQTNKNGNAFIQIQTTRQLRFHLKEYIRTHAEKHIHTHTNTPILKT